MERLLRLIGLTENDTSNIAGYVTRVFTSKPGGTTSLWCGVQISILAFAGVKWPQIGLMWYD